MVRYLPLLFKGCERFEKQGVAYKSTNLYGYEFAIASESGCFPGDDLFLNYMSILASLACNFDGITVSFSDRIGFGSFAQELDSKGNVLKYGGNTLSLISFFKGAVMRFSKKEGDKIISSTGWIGIINKEKLFYGGCSPIHIFWLTRDFVRFARKFSVPVGVHKGYVCFINSEETQRILMDSWMLKNPLEIIN